MPKNSLRFTTSASLFPSFLPRSFILEILYYKVTPVSQLSFSGYIVFYEMDTICSVEYFDIRSFSVLYVQLASFTIVENTVIVNVLTQTIFLSLCMTSLK